MNSKLIISLFAISILLAITVIAAGGWGSPIVIRKPEPEPEPEPETTTEEDEQLEKIKELLEDDLDDAVSDLEQLE